MDYTINSSFRMICECKSHTQTFHIKLDEEVSIWYSITIQYNNICPNPDIY